MSESRGRPGLRGNVDECGCDWEMGGGGERAWRKEVLIGHG